MNGRVYDPSIGRFLSADPFIQAPYNSQSYNRYSYVWNNPLSKTDPSGFVNLNANFRTAAEIAAAYMANSRFAFMSGGYYCAFGSGGCSVNADRARHGLPFLPYRGSVNLAVLSLHRSSGKNSEVTRDAEEAAAAYFADTRGSANAASAMGYGSLGGEITIDWDAYRTDPWARGIIDKWLATRYGVDLSNPANWGGSPRRFVNPTKGEMIALRIAGNGLLAIGTAGTSVGGRMALAVGLAAIGYADNIYDFVTADNNTERGLALSDASFSAMGDLLFMRVPFFGAAYSIGVDIYIEALRVNANETKNK